MKNILLLALLPFVLTIASCGNDEKTDTTKPTIQIQSPDDDAEFAPGETIPFEAIFKDNVELKSYKIEIHINDDGHSHGRKMETEEPFTYLKTSDFNRGLKESTVTLSIAIPDNAEHSQYDIGVYATDGAGNETVQFLKIYIEDEN